MPSADTALRAAAARFVHTLRVDGEDTDAGGVVFCANDLKFFERTRTEWLRSLGVQQPALRAATGAIFVVTDSQVGHRGPARLDDERQVSVELRHAGGAQLRIGPQARRGEALLADGEIRIGRVDAGTFRPRRIPTEVLDRLA